MTCGLFGCPQSFLDHINRYCIDMASCPKFQSIAAYQNYCCVMQLVVHPLFSICMHLDSWALGHIKHVGLLISKCWHLSRCSTNDNTETIYTCFSSTIASVSPFCCKLIPLDHEDTFILEQIGKFFKNCVKFSPHSGRELVILFECIVGKDFPLRNDDKCFSQSHE